MWDVTDISDDEHNRFTISTHTSRVGCDVEQRNIQPFEAFLLTHPVWDVTAYSGRNRTAANAFLLTHPVWDVTQVL